MWWIRRGSKYVPVTYTGFAYLNFFKFLFKIKAEVNGLRFSGDGMKVEGSKDV